MSACPSREKLDERAPEALRHAESCERCGARLRWLRHEEEVVRGWAAQDGAPTAHLWSGVQSRIAAARRRRFVVVGACAAAVLAATVWFARPAEEPEATPTAVAAIDRAEVEYQRAIEALEVQVARRAASHNHGVAIAQARSGLARARATSGKDAAGRVRLLEGYAAYLKSLRRALREAQ